MRKMAAFLLVICTLSPLVLADDLVPPLWRNSGLDTTFAIWEFDTDDMTPVPNVVDNPFGQTNLTVEIGPGMSYVENWGGRQGLWPLSGAFTIEIDNSPSTIPDKIVWIQLTWAQQTTYGEPGTIFDDISGATATLVQDTIVGETGESIGDGYWHHSVYSMVISPNPDFERIVISGGIIVDELVIDTICPEPMTLSMLAIGGVMLLRKKK